jgi:HK97 family phage major capsid protein
LEGIGFMKLADLQEARASAVAEMRGLTDKADAETRDLSDDEHKSFKSLKDKVLGLDRKIEIARDLAEAERSAPAILHNGRGDGSYETRARDFSVVKAIAAAIDDNVDAGLEREISAETERRIGRKARGILVPDQYFQEKRAFGDNVMLTTGVGADLYPTMHRPDLFIDRLRDALVVGRLGATVLDGLIGNVDIPRQTGSATAQWVAEDAALTDTTLTFDDVNLTPKTVGAITSYSRRMLINALPSIEAIVRNDLAAIVANAIDVKALVGDGTSNTPTGVVFSGAPEISVGGAPTWAKVLEFISTIQASNADIGSMAWVMNSATAAKLRGTLKTSTDTASNFLMNEPGSLAGFPVAITNALSDASGDSPSTEPYVIFGAWSQLLVGYWSGVDILVNPYESTAYQKARVLVRVLRDADVVVRHPQSFAWSEDLEIA